MLTKILVFLGLKKAARKTVALILSDFRKVIGEIEEAWSAHSEHADKLSDEISRKQIEHNNTLDEMDALDEAKRKLNAVFG